MQSEPYLKYCPRCKHYQEEATVCRRFSFNVGDYPQQFLKRCRGEAFELDDAKVRKQKEQSEDPSDLSRHEIAQSSERERDQEMLEPKSLARRAAMAVGLMVGFNLLALVLIAGLLFAAWAQVALAERVYIRFVFLTLIGAITIAWAIVPRFDRFLPPGPRLLKDEEPRLFARIEEIARKTEQEMPEEVYLLPELNAWVANRGGVMGFGSRRIMGIGWPLLAMVNVDEFDAILAHEFGHYHSGDTRLGPWVYKTHTAIGRTLANLGDDSILSLPFRSYGSYFLRTTMSISRNQEYTADRLAAQVVSAGALIGGLREIHAGSYSFNLYWHQEVRPVLLSGFAPPVMQGYRDFQQSARVQQAVKEAEQQDEEAAISNIYESHPSLEERIAALEFDDSRSRSRISAESAVTLIANLQQAESNLLAFLVESANGEELRKISWDEVTTEAYLPQWRLQAAEFADMYEEHTIGSLPEFIAARGREMAYRIRRWEDTPTDNLVLQFITPYLGSSLIVTLLESGWEVAAALGDPVSLRNEDHVLYPFQLVAELTGGKLTADEWRNLISEYQVNELQIAGSAH